MNNFLDHLRSLVTGNGSEVILPWFPEYQNHSREMKLVRESRIEPAGSRWINYPLAFALWTGLSIVATLKMCYKQEARTRKLTGVPCWRQFVQMLHLAWVKNLSPLDYLSSHFYNPEFRNEAEFYIPAFRQGRLSRKLNSNRPTERLDHKLKAYHSLKAAGLPTVEIIEVFHVDGSREFSKSNDALAEYVGQDLFVKPVNMYSGINARRWIHDKAQQQYSDGRISIPELDIWEALEGEARELGKDNPDKQARLVQPLVRNHPDLEPLSQYSLNTVRVIMMRFKDGKTEIFDANLRMAYGDAVADTGAIVGASIDLKTGCLRPGLCEHFLDQELPRHPTTGAQIEGIKVPYLKEVLSLARQAQEAFPENPIIGWDIAISPDGPMIVEANCNSNLSGVQFKTRQPLTRSLYSDLYWDWMGAD